MQIIEVSTPKHIKEFLQLPVRLYKGKGTAWICRLDKDIEQIFDPKKNKLFRGGEATRWILKTDGGETIGRVAGFINPKTAQKNDQPTGGMGFFECINDQEAANLLLDTCKNWLAKRDMEAMDGPINFGDRDRWWGMLAEGYEHEPNYCMPYNFPYYNELFQNYGFEIYFKQITFYREIKNDLKPKVFEKAQRILDNPDFEFRHLEMKKLEQYADDFQEIYNEAWAKHGGVAKMSKLQARAIMKTMKPILDPEIVWFGYYKGEPVAFYIIIPELNQITKFLNGRFDWLGKGLFMFHKLRGACKKIFGVIFGVVPAHQRKGVEAAIVVAYSKIALKPGYKYKDMEFNWIGDFNPKMICVCEDVGGVPRKIHHTYRYLFDRTKEFKRMTIIK